MTTLQTVYIKARPLNCYGETTFDIREIGTGFMVRADIGRYDTAREIAERIDDQHLASVPTSDKRADRTLN